MTAQKYRLAVRDALAEEMERDDRVFLMGQDVGAPGGLFRFTEGLHERFGPDRVRDTPISEAAVLGAAIGAALGGLRPVLEVSFADFVAVCFDGLVNQLAKIPFMWRTQLSGLPVVIRAMTGAGIAAGPQHSQSVENWLASVPGLTIVAPGSPGDVKALLKASIRSDGPVIVLEHKALLRERGEVGGADVVGVLGKAERLRRGGDVTVVTYSAMCRVVMAAAERLAHDGIGVEVVDLRTVTPLDRETIVTSVARTGRLVVVHEAHGPFGIAAEVMAVVGEECWRVLQAPMIRVTPPAIPVPVSRALEQRYLPSVDDVVSAVRASVSHG